MLAQTHMSRARERATHTSSKKPSSRRSPQLETARSRMPQHASLLAATHTSRMPQPASLLGRARVVYTSAGLPDAVLPRTTADKCRSRRADARVHVAMRDAWADPAAARAHLAAASCIYASIKDAQGMANALVAHADAVRADSHLASLSVQSATPAAERAACCARGEYAKAAQIYGALAEAGDTAWYDVRRQRPVWAAMREQRRRPLNLTLVGPQDALACLVGGDESQDFFAPGKARWHHTAAGWCEGGRRL